MAKNYEVEEEIMDFEEGTEVTVVEKKSLWTKTKEKVSKIPDLTLRDVGKASLKVVGVAAAAGAAVYGAVKLFGNNDGYDDVIIETLDDGTVIISDPIEETTEE